MHSRSSSVTARTAFVMLLAIAAAAPMHALRAQGARGEGVGAGHTFPYSSVFVATGANYTFTTDLNARLVDGNYFAVSNDGISYGGGVRSNWGRMVFGGEFATVDFGEEGSPVNGRTSALTSRYSLAQVGYATWAGRHLNIYPMLGVGAGSVTLKLSDRNGGGTPPAGINPTFTELVLHPDGHADITGIYMLFEPAIGADWLVLRSVADRFGVTFGVRVGKRIAPNRTTWKHEGRTVVGGPDAGPSGSFMRLTVGVGWR